MTEIAAGKRSKLVVGVAVVAIVAIGSGVGVVAMHLARRAPRAAGVRVAVVDVDGESWAEDAMARLLATTPGVSVVPSVEVTSRLHVMQRKDPKAVPLDAAHALDLDALVSGAVHAQSAFHALNLDGTGILVDAHDPDIRVVARAIAAKLSPEGRAGPDAPLPTKDLGAYRNFADAENARDQGKLAQAFEQALLAFRVDKTCGPCALLVVELSLLDAGSAFDANEAMKAVDDNALGDRDRFMAQGFRALLQKNVEGALDAFRKVTVDFPEDPAGHFWLGRVYNRDVNAGDEALRHLENAKRIVPDQRIVYEEIADAWVKIGERANALGQMNAYLKMFPDDADARRVRDAIEQGMPTKPTIVQ